MKLKFKDVLPNPRRDLKRNPLKREKIEELVTSINTTGFWDNVLTRKNKAGKYELAYGHHRVQAAIEAGLESADFIVKDLSDALMIQIMDNENREVYGSSPASLIESVRAVVEALDEGSIPPFDIDPKTRKEVIHYAPSYVPNNDEDVSSKPSQKAYTAKHIAVFLGRTVPNEEGREGVRAPDEIKAALRALGLKELGHFSDSMLITKDRTGSPKPITTKEFVKITGDITRDVVKVQERQGKTRQELETLRAEQLEIQAKAKADKKSADEAEKKRIKEISAAREEENFKKAEALAAKLKK
jgi:ParB-like chromosome segregation protein Spo0J